MIFREIETFPWQKPQQKTYQRWRLCSNLKDFSPRLIIINAEYLFPYRWQKEESYVYDFLDYNFGKSTRESTCHNFSCLVSAMILIRRQTAWNCHCNRHISNRGNWTEWLSRRMKKELLNSSSKSETHPQLLPTGICVPGYIKYKRVYVIQCALSKFNNLTFWV